MTNIEVDDDGYNNVLECHNALAKCLDRYNNNNSNKMWSIDGGQGDCVEYGDCSAQCTEKLEECVCIGIIIRITEENEGDVEFQLQQQHIDTFLEHYREIKWRIYIVGTGEN